MGLRKCWTICETPAPTPEIIGNREMKNGPLMEIIIENNRIIVEEMGFSSFFPINRLSKIGYCGLFFYIPAHERPFKASCLSAGHSHRWPPAVLMHKYSQPPFSIRHSLTSIFAFKQNLNSEHTYAPSAVVVELISGKASAVIRSYLKKYCVLFGWLIYGVDAVVLAKPVLYQALVDVVLASCSLKAVHTMT